MPVNLTKQGLDILREKKPILCPIINVLFQFQIVLNVKPQKFRFVQIMRDTGNRECSIIFNPRGCRINMSPLCLTASFPAKYFYNISILIWRKPRKYFDKKFQFSNYDPGCFRSYFPLYLTIFQSGFCPQVLCASQRGGGGGGGGGGWGGRQRRRRRTLTQNTTLPHNSHTQLRPLAHKMCNFQHTSRKCSQFSTAREIYRERGRT